MSPLIEDVLPAPAQIHVADAAELPPSIKRPISPFDGRPSRPHARRIGVVLFGAVGIVGLVYVITRLVSDLSIVHSPSVYPYLLLGVALLTALGFEFVNGFHDTANAVATVIYTHSLDPRVAVVWSGIWNFIGVLMSSGAVAFSIIALLPADLILKAGRGTGFSMIFALLVAAILWNLGTWYRGLPVSSSHTMIGSVLGVAIAYRLSQGHSHLNTIDWDQVTKVLKALVFSPLIGFAAAFVLYLLFKWVLRDPRLFKAPVGAAPPPLYIRALLILTCTGVSYAHGSNDGQKGMGLIMLILAATVPTAYAVNTGIHATSSHFIPFWVKVAVALALGLGTMVGWKRIVITVGEKIGKEHLTYAQGAAAELTAMVTILGASAYGLPVSTTHVLSSAVAGTMSASGSGVRSTTIRNIAMAWFFTLPAAALLSGLLFIIFSKIAR
jgi:PiT family inorganic phosphate transporter